MGLLSVSRYISHAKNQDWKVSAHFKGPKPSYLIYWKKATPATSLNPVNIQKCVFSGFGASHWWLKSCVKGSGWQSAETMTVECSVTNGTSVPHPSSQSSGTILEDRTEKSLEPGVRKYKRKAVFFCIWRDWSTQELTEAWWSAEALKAITLVQCVVGSARESPLLAEAPLTGGGCLARKR